MIYYTRKSNVWPPDILYAPQGAFTNDALKIWGFQIPPFPLSPFVTFVRPPPPPLHFWLLFFSYAKIETPQFSHVQ